MTVKQWEDFQKAFDACIKDGEKKETTIREKGEQMNRLFEQMNRLLEQMYKLAGEIGTELRLE